MPSKRPESKMKFPAPIMTLAAAVVLAAVPALRGAPQASQQGSPQGESQVRQDNATGNSQDQVRVPYALPKGAKLILTNGTFQVVREYSIVGDRVRYWSLERSQWEEIPSAMVDWDATHKAEKEQAKEEAELKAKIRTSELAERTRDIDVDRSLEIKPGLFLPDGVGFYLVEGKLIFPMKQSLASSKLSTGREITRILTSMPIIPSKQSLEVPGAHSAIRVTTADPEFFMRPADDRDPRMQLLKAQVKGDHRVLETVNIHQSGERVHYSKELDFQTWTPARGVFRYTFDQPLKPGEYAFVEITQDGINGYVWDFGVDPPGTKSQK
jgi:hypothetical protein